jgi:hypothetical protein
MGSVDEEDRSNENRTLTHFNGGIKPTSLLMIETDATNVPDNNSRRPLPSTSRCALSLSLSLSLRGVTMLASSETC